MLTPRTAQVSAQLGHPSGRPWSFFGPASFRLRVGVGSGWGPPELSRGAQQWTNQTAPTSAVSRKDTVLCMVLHELDPKAVPGERAWNGEGGCDYGHPALSGYTDAGLFLTITHLTA